LEPLSQEPVALARIISLGLLVLVGLWAFNTTRRYSSRSDPVHAIHLSVILISIYVLFSAVVFPWYLTLLLALLPLIRLQKSGPVILFSAGWLYFSGAVNLSYLTYLDPQTPQELGWVRSVEYIPLWITLIAALFLLRKARIMTNLAPLPASEKD
jgi:hypothetical protein